MNWYKISQNTPIVRDISYNQTNNQLNVVYRNGNKRYTYEGVSPYIYNRIENLLKYNKYSEVVKILRRLSVLSQN